MSKRRVILVDDKEWVEIRIECFKRGISTGNYLIDLHRERVKDLPKNESKLGHEVKKEMVTEKPKTLYTEEYRKKNPMETCKICGKAIKFCSH